MLRYRAEIEIDAPPDRVWAVLHDLPRYAEWNPFTLKVESSLALGAPVDMRVHMPVRGLTISQREYVRACDPPRSGSVGRLDWGTRMLGGWLVRAERTQRVEALPGGRTRYVTEDVIEGPFAPLVRRLFGRDLQQGFEAMASALEARCRA